MLSRLGNPEDKISKIDANQKIAKVIKTLKTLRFNAGNIVAREDEKVIALKTNMDANRGPITSFDIIEDCQVTCKVHVKDRKGPFKININYNRNESKIAPSLDSN